MDLSFFPASNSTRKLGAQSRQQQRSDSKTRCRQVHPQRNDELTSVGVFPHNDASFLEEKWKIKWGRKDCSSCYLMLGRRSVCSLGRKRERGFGRWALIILLQLGRDLISIMSPSDCQELSELDLDCGRSKSIAAQLGRVPGVDNAPFHFSFPRVFSFLLVAGQRREKCRSSNLLPKWIGTLSLSLCS